MKNGITLNDLEKAENDAYNQGLDIGFKQAAPSVIKMAYAAIILALNDKGLTSIDSYELLRSVDHYILTGLTSIEMCDEVLERTGIELNFGEPTGAVIKITKEDN